MSSFVYEMRLHGILVVVFIILDWIFVLMNLTSVISCRRPIEGFAILRGPF